MIIATAILGVAIIGIAVVAFVIFTMQADRPVADATPITPKSPVIGVRKPEAAPTETPNLATIAPTPPPTYTAYPTYTPLPVATLSPTTETNTNAVWLCLEADFDGSTCNVTRNTFPNTTIAVYATWQNSDALRQHLEFTRRWLKDGVLILESANAAGENTRWTPSDGLSYYVYLSAVEGTGKQVFNAPTLPRGTYTFELLINGVLFSVQDFFIE